MSDAEASPHTHAQRLAAILERRGASPTAAAALHADLCAAYAAPGRHYHDLAHIHAVLTALEGHPDAAQLSAEDADALCLAAWFHDAVYVTDGQVDNEAASADEADRQLAALGWPEELRAQVRALILATRHRSRPADLAAALLMDADLEALAVSPEQFRANGEAIRREYAAVPDDVFWSQRARILRVFLERPRLYFTAHTAARCDAAARRNLLAELARITAA